MFVSQKVGINTASGRLFTTGYKSLFIYLMMGSRLTMGGAILFLVCLSVCHHHQPRFKAQKVLENV